MAYTHKAEVFKIKELHPHPNADKLEIVKIFDGECAVKIGDFHVGDLAVFVQPDSCLPDIPEYNWLKGKLRIRAQKLRGYISAGLVLKAPEGAKEGDDVAEQLGITHYDPPEPGQYQSGPKKNRRFVPRSMAPQASVKVYDVEPWFRYADCIPEGTPVVAEEKIHGCNTRVLCENGKIFVGSRQYWLGYRYVSKFKKLVNKYTHGLLFADNVNDSDWWETLDANPKILAVVARHPGLVFFMEMYGAVQDLRYGAIGKQRWLAIFDIYNTKTGSFMTPATRNFLLELEGLFEYMVPVVRLFDYHKDQIKDMVSGKSFVATAPEGHIREGIVIKPFYNEIYDSRLGRVIVKAVSPEYLSRGK